MTKIFLAVTVVLHFWESFMESVNDAQDPRDLERSAARLREIERHPESLIGGGHF